MATRKINPSPTSSVGKNPSSKPSIQDASQKISLHSSGQAHKNRIQAKRDASPTGPDGNYKSTKIARDEINKKTRTAGSTPINVQHTPSGVHLYTIGKDPRHAARLRAVAARKRDKK